MSRPRKHIPLGELLGATLAMLLPQDVRDDLRARRVPWRQVRGLFDFDHVVLHAHGGADKWWNLTPMERGPHRIKAARDTRVVAKGKRISEQEERWRTTMRLIGSKRKRLKPKGRWPSKRR